MTKFFADENFLPYRMDGSVPEIVSCAAKGKPDKIIYDPTFRRERGGGRMRAGEREKERDGERERERER